MVKPVCEVDEEDSSPSTACSAPSSGWATCLSMTSGEAPGWEATTEIRGNSSEGMSSCLSCPIVITPKTATNTVINAIRARLPSESTASRCICHP